MRQALISQDLWKFTPPNANIATPPNANLILKYKLVSNVTLVKFNFLLEESITRVLSENSISFGNPDMREHLALSSDNCELASILGESIYKYIIQ